MSKWNLNFDSSSHEEDEDEDYSEKLNLSHLKVDQVPQKNFWDHLPPTQLTLGVPGVENHEPMFGTNYSSSTQSDPQQPQQRNSIMITNPSLEILDKESRGRKREYEENLLSEFDANGSGITSRRNEDGLQQYSKASSVEMHKMSERRRRNRIASKVKTLAELIPNCNKTNRASVLDQAIQYIQALQHQVQVMSMDGIPAWYSASTLLARRNQIVRSTLQFNPYMPIMPSISADYFLGFAKSINYCHMISSNFSPMISTGSHFPFLPLVVVNNSECSPSVAAPEKRA
ncbi:unnamed protein product [Withania somnifera]